MTNVLSTKPINPQELKILINDNIQECELLIRKAIGASGIPQSEDNLQELFLKIWDKCDNFDSSYGIRASTYIYSVAYQCALNLRSKFIREPKMIPMGIVYKSREDNYENLKFEFSDYINRYNHSLMSQILEMKFLHGKTQKEIAEELNLSHAYVNFHLQQWKKENLDEFRNEFWPGRNF